MELNAVWVRISLRENRADGTVLCELDAVFMEDERVLYAYFLSPFLSTKLSSVYAMVYLFNTFCSVWLDAQTHQINV